MGRRSVRAVALCPLPEATRRISELLTRDVAQRLAAINFPPDQALGRRREMLAARGLYVPGDGGRSANRVFVQVIADYVRPGMPPVPVRGAYQTGSPAEWPQFDSLITLYLNAAMTPRQLLPTLQWEILLRLCHETQHAVDQNDQPLRRYDPSVREDLIEYANSPSEIRAYARQIVLELQRFKYVGRIEEAVEKTPTWGHIQPYLTPKGRRLILEYVAGSIGQ